MADVLVYSQVEFVTWKWIYIEKIPYVVMKNEFPVVLPDYGGLWGLIQIIFDTFEKSSRYSA